MEINCWTLHRPQIHISIHCQTCKLPVTYCADHDPTDENPCKCLFNEPDWPSEHKSLMCLDCFLMYYEIKECKVREYIRNEHFAFVRLLITGVHIPGINTKSARKCKS